MIEKARAAIADPDVVGYLLCALERPPRMTGLLLCDHTRSFPEGLHIRTQAIAERCQRAGYEVVTTTDGGIFVVAHWLHENGALDRFDRVHSLMSPLMAFAGKKGRKMGLPQCVLDAQKIDFGVPISGYLCCAEYQLPCMTGVIFSEARGRFADGKTIRTSLVERVYELRGYQLCETHTGSRYVVCHWWYENGALPEINLIH